MNKNIVYSLVTLLVLALLGGGAYLYFTKNAAVPAIPQEGDAQTGSSGGVKVSLDGVPEGATVTVEDRLNAELYDKTPKPSLERALPKGTFTDEQYAILKKQRDGLVSAIQANPVLMSQWIQLGILHKQVGDYQGARIYWTYVTTVNPNNLVAHWNLGSLYELYLKDAQVAQKEFAAVIALDPAYIAAYVESATLYVESGNQTQAVAMLSKGIEKNAGVIDLYIARARIYRDMHNRDAARADYTKAIQLAGSQKNTALVDALTAEVNAL